MSKTIKAQETFKKPKPKSGALTFSLEVLIILQTGELFA